LRFEPSESAELEGIPEPVPLFRATANGNGPSA